MPHRTPIYIKAEITVGTSLGDAFQEALKVANQLQCGVRFRLHREACRVHPGDDWKTFYDRHWSPAEGKQRKIEELEEEIKTVRKGDR